MKQAASYPFERGSSWHVPRDCCYGRETVIAGREFHHFSIPPDKDYITCTLLIALRLFRTSSNHIADSIRFRSIGCCLDLLTLVLLIGID